MSLRLRYPEGVSLDEERHFEDCCFHNHATNGNGGCAIHSVFASGRDSDGKFFLPNCRQFLREKLGETANDCAHRVNEPTLFREWVEKEFWQDTIASLCKPVLKGESNTGLTTSLGQEQHDLWKAIQNNTSLYNQLFHFVSEEQQCLDVHEQSRKQMVEAFGCLCVRPLQACFLHPLLKRLGVFEEFCITPYTNVAGQAFTTRLEVILTDGAHATHLKRSLLETKGVDSMEELAYVVNMISEASTDLPEAYIPKIKHFCCRVSEAGGRAKDLKNHAFDGFILAYPTYLELMCKDDYYLSNIELRILCRCANQSVVICIQDPDTQRLVYLSQDLVNTEEPVFTSLLIREENVQHTNTVRTHFERLENVYKLLGTYGD